MGKTYHRDSTLLTSHQFHYSTHHYSIHKANYALVNVQATPTTLPTTSSLCSDHICHYLMKYQGLDAAVMEVDEGMVGVLRPPPTESSSSSTSLGGTSFSGVKDNHICT